MLVVHVLCPGEQHTPPHQHTGVLVAAALLWPRHELCTRRSKLSSWLQLASIVPFIQLNSQPTFPMLSRCIGHSTTAPLESVLRNPNKKRKSKSLCCSTYGMQPSFDAPRQHGTACVDAHTAAHPAGHLLDIEFKQLRLSAAGASRHVSTFPCFQPLVLGGCCELLRRRCTHASCNTLLRSRTDGQRNAVALRGYPRLTTNLHTADDLGVSTALSRPNRTCTHTAA